MIAHQYYIRNKKSIEEMDLIGFNPEDANLNDCEIKLIDKATATKIILEYEWLGTMPYITRYHFGIYFNINGNSVLGGVLTFGDDYAENTGVWKKYGFEDKTILLNRGVCLWWTPKNTASYFIARACTWIKKNTKYRIITATVDPAAGEIGTIYQSLNWKYVGLMTGNYYHNKESKRFSVLINGKLRYSRWIRNDVGTMKKDDILKKYPDAKFIQQYRKRRYFYFIDTPKLNKKHNNSIKYLIQPYPKRDSEIIGIIYKIENITNHKLYFGQTIRSLNDRICDYKNGLGNTYLNNSIKKYGWDNFKFSIVDTAETFDDLNLKEINYILKHNTNNRDFGYNIESGGKNSSPNIETIEKMSKSHLGIIQTNIWIENRIAKAGTEEAKKYGKIKTNEERDEISKKSPRYWLGKERDSITKDRISKTKLKNGMSDKQKIALNKRVYKTNLGSNLVIEYDSTAIASKAEGVNQSTIARRCISKKIVENVLWSY